MELQFHNGSYVFSTLCLHFETHIAEVSKTKLWVCMHVSESLFFPFFHSFFLFSSLLLSDSFLFSVIDANSNEENCFYLFFLLKIFGRSFSSHLLKIKSYANIRRHSSAMHTCTTDNQNIVGIGVEFNAAYMHKRSDILFTQVNLPINFWAFESERA